MLTFLCTAARVLSQGVSASIRTVITNTNDIINKMDRDLAEGHHLRSVSCLGTKSFKTMLHIVSHCLFPPSGPLEAQDDVHWASWPETVVRAAGGACQVGSCYGRRGAIKEKEEA